MLHCMVQDPNAAQGSSVQRCASQEKTHAHPRFVIVRSNELAHCPHHLRIRSFSDTLDDSLHRIPFRQVGGQLQCANYVFNQPLRCRIRWPNCPVFDVQPDVHDQEPVCFLQVYGIPHAPHQMSSCRNNLQKSQTYVSVIDLVSNGDPSTCRRKSGLLHITFRTVSFCRSWFVEGSFRIFRVAFSDRSGICTFSKHFVFDASSTSWKG